MTRFGSVVCISPETLGGRIIKQQLTYGKVYDIVTPGQMGDSKIYFIENDEGIREFYRQDRFVTLEDWREMQLKKIL